jgi:hypothetical protein
MPCEEDLAFEVDEEAWEEEGLMDLVCCLEVYLEEAMPGPSGKEALQPVEEEPKDAQVHEHARDSDERKEGEGEFSDVAEVSDNVGEDGAHEEEAEKGQDKEEQEEEEEEQTEEEEKSTVRARPFGRRRRAIVSDDDDSPRAFDRDSRLAADLQQIQKDPVIDDSQPSAPSAKNRVIAVCAQNVLHVPGESLPAATTGVCNNEIHRYRTTN